MWPDGSGPTLIVDDGGDATLLVHKGVEFEGNEHTFREFNPADEPEEWGVILDLLRQEIARDPQRWTRVAKTSAAFPRRRPPACIASIRCRKPARCCSRPSTSMTR